VPTIKQNLDKWDEAYDWNLSEDQWSKAWGSAVDQWYGSIYPRVQRFLPADSILEIAPGFGRWTEFLLQHCETLIGVDVSPKCTEACSERFADRKGASFYTNDGRSLPMVKDASVDLAFSFDSLVHVEADVLAQYLVELARCLRTDGVAFLHHSNYGAYRRPTELLAPIQSTLDRLPRLARHGLFRVGVYRSSHWRAPSVTASTFVELCEQAGLRCIGQELINWAGGVLLLDCISVVTRPGSRWDRPNRVVINRLFRLQARATRRSATAYAPN
jgi:ubiquinone/menaquinone biosynthesis C-methylase UbiE